MAPLKGSEYTAGWFLCTLVKKSCNILINSNFYRIVKEKDFSCCEMKEQTIQDYGFCACKYITIISVLFMKRHIPMSMLACSRFHSEHSDVYGDCAAVND